MAEEVKEKGPSAPPSGAGAPVSEDWEAAFKAEDYMFSPEAEEVAIPAAPSIGEIPVAPTEEAVAKAGEGEPRKKRALGLSAMAGKGPSIFRFEEAFNAVKAAVQLLTERLLSLSPIHRLMVAGAIVLVLGAAGGIFFYGKRSAAPVAVTPEEEHAAPATGVAEHVSPQVEKQPEPPPHREELVDAGEAAAIRGKVRWPLAAFLVSAMPEQGERVPALITVEVTLIAAEGASGELQADHVGRVRDIVYQFFANRPLSELRRYSIARGDMKRDLLAWIKKQWPSTTVEAVQVNRYQAS